MAARKLGGVPARQLFTIVTMIAALIAILVLRKRCGMAIEQLFRAMEPPPATQIVDGGAH
jgi:hypothetical protein